MNLREQLFDCLPAGRYALAGLLRLLDLVETRAVATAAVECQAQPRLLINPDFVTQHADTPEKLMMLVMHEVHHVLLGHTRRLPSRTRVDNFVFDCVINALLSRMFPQPEYTALFRSFYPDDAFPACLLRPPEGWDPRVARAPVPPGLAALGDAGCAAREVYAALYSREGASYDEIRSLLPQLVIVESGVDAVPLLGDHDGSAAGPATASDSAFARAAAELVVHWPTPPEPLRGRSLQDLRRDTRAAPRRIPGNRERLRELIRKLAGAEGPGSIHRREARGALFSESATPTMDRRAVVARAFGVTPLLYRAEAPRRDRIPASERVHVYVDVSGSMDGIKGVVYGAVLDCAPWVAPQIHLFSTVVAETTLRDLRQGICNGTGGTDIGCVATHMDTHRVKRALLLTDGFVGKPSVADATVLAAVRIGVAYIGNHNASDLAPYSCDTVVLSL